MLVQRNSRKQGDVGLGRAIAYFTKLGQTVAIPLTDSQHYDLIVDNGAVLLRVQVKTTRHKADNGSYEVGLRTSGGNKSGNTINYFDNKSSDILFVLAEDGTEWVIPTSDVEARHGIVLGSKYDKHRIS